MPSESDAEPALPFGDLPQPTSPSQPRKRNPSKFKQLVKDGDWETYEASVLDLLRQAIEQYQRRHPGEKVYQISIWTDPQTQTSAINFETKQHAEEYVAKWTQIFRQKYNDEETASRMEADGYNDNPANFKHREFLLHKHPEIEALDDLNYSYMTHQHAAGARISASLRRVVKRVREQNTLAGLPREEEVWIGVSSPRDWYDHVAKI